MGLLLTILFLTQISAVGWAYAELHPRQHDTQEMPVLHWHRFTVAATNALLAMVSIIGGAGLIVNVVWAWRIIQIGAVLQIIVTLATQALEAVLSMSDTAHSEQVLLAAIVGMIAWSIIPVGILVLATVGYPRSKVAAI